MKVFVLFNLFCLAAFLQMASRAPLVDENEQPLEPAHAGGWTLLRDLIHASPLK